MTQDKNQKRPAWKRWLKRILAVLVVLFSLLLILSTVGIVMAWSAFGKGAEGERLERMKRSPQWRDGGFVNPQPLWNDGWRMFTEMVFNRQPETAPELPPEVYEPAPQALAQAPKGGLRVTWLGHSTTLIEIEGKRFLTDPVWSDRASPLQFVGPKRWTKPVIELSELPKIDAVLISHDHYDHLDMNTIKAMKDWNTTFIMPLGVGAHLEYWGVDAEKIVELDWWETHPIGPVQLTASPARHASGRHPFDQNHTLWAGFALRGSAHAVYYSGDTGFFPGLEEIGQRLGPFDLAMFEIGAYSQAWPDWHMGPEQALMATQMVRAQLFLPIHWGLFDLANHSWTEPIERAIHAAEALDIVIATPQIGQSLEPQAIPQDRWWPQLEWRAADDYPIEARGID